MSIHFVITAIGDDQPGLVEQLSSIIRAHQGNWLESSMANLAGKFAGIVRVSVPEKRATALKAELESMHQLRVIAEVTHGTGTSRPAHVMNLSLIGHDRMGIVQEVTAVLARFAVNVEDLTTSVSSAPMSGETLFHASARLGVDAGTDVDALQSALEAISRELFVEVTLAEV